MSPLSNSKIPLFDFGVAEKILVGILRLYQFATLCSALPVRTSSISIFSNMCPTENKEMKSIFLAIVTSLTLTLIIGGCASITNDSHQQINFKAPGCKGKGVTCIASNKRGLWKFELPGIELIRRSDDVLKIECEDKDGNNYQEAVPSRLGGKIIVSAIFLDFGIVDAITDKHREYPSQIVIDMCL